MPRFLKTDDAAVHLLVNAEGSCRLVHAVLAIHSHCPHVTGSDDELSYAILVTVVARLPLCCPPSRSASAPLHPGKLFFLYLFLFTLVFSNSCPRSRLRFLSREECSALPPRVGPPILHARAKSGAYSRTLILPPAFRDGAAVGTNGYASRFS